MTPADPLTVLLDRACRGLTSDEAAALRAAVGQLQQQTARYRAAWQSARRRARLIPEAGQEIHDGTRWRPALQAYSALRARLTRAEQELAALHGQTPQPAEPRTHNSHIWEDEDGWHVSCEHYDCPDSSRDVGSEYDAEEWAEQHQAEATSSQAPR
ncbi:hypothetical protein ACWEPB_02615 [Kitasatospora cineracea]